MTYVASRVAGTILLILGLYIVYHCIWLLDLRHDALSAQLRRPLSPELRLAGGVIGLLLFALPIGGFGLRLLARPGKLHDEV